MRSRSIAATSSASLGAADFAVGPTDAIAPAAGFAVAAAEGGEESHELRQLLVRAGEHAEFVEGALVVNSSVRVRKKGANKLLLEGSYGPDYLLVRSMLYSQVEAV